MNYRHAYHAGSAADVLKHAVVARIIEQLKRKPTPFRFLDLHAGRGFYDLTSPEAERTGEWRAGVGRLYRHATCEPDPLPGPAETLLAAWRKVIASCNDGERLAHYPGSPEFGRRLAREEDRLVLNELHAADSRALADRLRGEPRAKVVNMDAWAAMRAFLPPPQRRGLTLADPPFETIDELGQALAGIAEARRRFASGVFCLWYPVKGAAAAEALAVRVARLRWPKTLRLELRVRTTDQDERLNGSGLMVFNPPWALASEMDVLCPALAERLSDPAASRPGSSRVEWLVGEEEPQAGGENGFGNKNAGPEGSGPA
jgi:23S rRNA (adenine2030-N6)-methyltransferase